MSFVIRPARLEDATALQEIERLAGQRFREIGLDKVADDEPISVEALGRYTLDGRAWVAVTHTDEPVGYVLVDVVDGSAHVEQVSVLPDHQGLGVGRALLDRVFDWAQQTGRRAITLTTFSAVPWNRPLYEQLGFEVLAEKDIGRELRAVRVAEAARGLGPSIRVCMRREVSANHADPGRRAPRNARPFA